MRNRNFLYFLVLAASFTTLTYAQDTLTGLVGSWNFDESSGNAADQSGYGNSLTVNACPRDIGVSGNGVLVGPGSNGTATISSTGAWGDYSIYFAVNYKNLDATTGDQLLTLNPSPTIMMRREASLGNFTGFHYASASWEPRVSSGVIPATNVWYYIMMNRSNSNISIYVNGSLKATSIRTSNFISPTSIALSAGGPSTFVMDDLRLYKRCLSSNDLAALMSPPPCAAVTNLTNQSLAFPGFTLRGSNVSSLIGFTNFNVMVSNMAGAVVWNQAVIQDSATSWQATPTFPAPGDYDITVSLSNNGSNGAGFVAAPMRVTVVSPVQFTVKLQTTNGTPMAGAQVFLSAPLPNDGGFRTTDGNGVATFTNMIPSASITLTNYGPVSAGGNELWTNVTLGSTNTTLIWTTPLPTPYASDIRTGLVGYWNFNEASGNSLDQTAKGNALTVGACARVSGFEGNGVLIGPGSNCSVNLPNVGALGDYSLSFDIQYLNIDGSLYEALVVLNPSKLAVRRESGPGNFAAFPYYAEPRASSGVTPSVNSWYNVLVTRSNGTISIYVNGALKGTSVPANTSITPTSLSLGSSGSSSFIMDEVRLYSRALTSNDARCLSSFAPGAAITNATNGLKVFAGTPVSGTNHTPLIGLAQFSLLVTHLSGTAAWTVPVTRLTPTGWTASPSFPANGFYDLSLVMTNDGIGGFTFLSPPTRIQVVPRVKLNVKVLSTAGDPVPYARVFLVAEAPNESGIRVTDGTGLATYTNMMPLTTAVLTNYAPRSTGAMEVGTNWTMAGTDETLVWTVPYAAPPAPVGPVPAEFRAYLTANASELVLGVVPNRYTVITATALTGGRKFTLYDGLASQGTLRLGADRFRYIPPGVLVLEIKSSEAGVDDFRSVVTRQLLFLAR